MLGKTWLMGALAAAMLGISALAGAADDGAGAVRRDGHRLIRIQVESQKQLDQLIAMGAQPWNCVIGPGRQEFSVSPAVLKAIQARGIAFETLQEDVQALIDAERARLFGPANHNGEPWGAGGPAGAEGGIAGGAEWFIEYKTYPQVNDYIDTLAALRPDLASKVTVGTTIEGRTIYGMRITSPVGSGKPAVIFSGCQHAREWVAVMVPMYIADALVRRYDTDAQIHDLLDRVEFFIVPIVNPDGYEYTYAPKGDRLWRKNRRDNLQGDFGVDLNRNWGVDWGGPNSTSSNPASEVYYGTGAFSEPETAALRDFIAARPQLKAHIDFHSYAQLILQNWGYTNLVAPDIDVIASFGADMNGHLYPVHQTFYQNGWGGSLLYLASGVFPDWCYGQRGMISFTIELRDTGQFGFELPADQIVPTATEALPAALTLADRISRGIEFLYPRGRPPVAVAGSPATFTVDVRPLAGTTVQPGSPTVFYRYGPGQPFAAAPLVLQGAPGSTLYTATIPAAVCGAKVQYYIQAANAANAVFRSPADAPASFHEATAVTPSLFYNFEAAAGWTTSSNATTGAWQRGVPANSLNWPYDPFNDADGSGQCWLTQNTTGNFTDVGNGFVQLRSPVFDLSFYASPAAGAARPVISYSYFLHLSAADEHDSLTVELSSGGAAGPWTTIATHDSSGGTQWRSNAVNPYGLVALSSNMMLRFTASDNLPSSIVEAAVDGVRISTDCGPLCPADLAPPGGNCVVDIDDLLTVIGCWGPTGSCGDIAPAGGNGIVDIDDLLKVINAWGPCP